MISRFEHTGVGGGAFEIQVGPMSLLCHWEPNPAFDIVIHFFPTPDTWLLDTGCLKCWSKVTSRVQDGGEGNGRLGLSIPFEVAPGGVHSKLWM